MKPDRRSDSSPMGSDTHGGSWNSQSLQWDYEEGTIPGLTIEHNRELATLVEDKDVASKAVAFVVHSTRKGIVPLCADVANLLRSKNQLHERVKRLKQENERLRQSLSTSISTASMSRPSLSDKSADHIYNNDSGQRYSGGSSHSSSLVSNSPKLEKYYANNHHNQRSPRLHRTSAFTLTKPSSVSPNNHLAIATVHHNSAREESSQKHHHHQKGHERKNSLPQIVSIPQADIPRVIPKVRCESKEVQCSILESCHTEKLEEQFKETLKCNTELAEQLGAAKKEIQVLKAKVKEFEMTKLARLCLDDFRVEDECKKETKSSSVKTKRCSVERNPYKGIPLHHQKTSIDIDRPIESCRCVSCEEKCQQSHQSSSKKVKMTVVSDHQLREETGLSVSDHVVVKGDRTGFVRYIGHLDNVGKPHAIFVGLELDAPVGRHNGIFNGKRYFKCTKEHGIFLPVTEIICIITEKVPSSCNSYKSIGSVGSSDSTLSGSITTIHIGPSAMPISPIEFEDNVFTSETHASDSKKEKAQGNTTVVSADVHDNHSASIRVENTTKSKQDSKDKPLKSVKKKECKFQKFFNKKKDLYYGNEKRYPVKSTNNLKLARSASIEAVEMV